MSAELFAWARPIAPGALIEYMAVGVLGPLDHTWVTSYDNRIFTHSSIYAVRANAVDYWYCWGVYHPRGGTSAHPDGLLSRGGADLAIAKCLVTENLPCQNHNGACGTVFRYLIDGVCHQLANQVLVATANGRTQPLTVRDANGYKFSAARYGSYGRQDAQFRRNMIGCSSGGRISSAKGNGTMLSLDMPELADEFSDHVHAVLDEKDPALAERLLALRNRLQELDDEASESYDFRAITQRGHDFLAAAEDMLGEEYYFKIFGLKPGQRITIPPA